jgi:hypothetical protein
MRLSLLVLAAASTFLAACGPEPKPATTEAPRKAEVVKPADETRRFPLANQVDTKVVDKELMGKAFMPGGTLAHYKKGKTEYDMFVGKLPGSGDAALLLPDWSKALTDSTLVPSFGGYFGMDSGRPVFVFAKGSWIAGIAGLPQKDADLLARTLAAQLN